MLLLQMTTALTKLLCVLGVLSSIPANFLHKLLYLVWYGRSYSSQWYSCKWWWRSQSCYVCSEHILQYQRVFPTKFCIEYDMEELIPPNDTLANDDDAHKAVMCARSTFFNTSEFSPQSFVLSMIWKNLFLPMILLQMMMTLTKLLCVLGAHSSIPASFPHKVLYWVWYGRTYSSQWYSCKWRWCSQSCYVCSEHILQYQRIFPTKFCIEYDMEDLIPPNDTLANDDDDHLQKLKIIILMILLNVMTANIGRKNVGKLVHFISFNSCHESFC